MNLNSSPPPTKKCLVCGVSFYKKVNESRSYWETKSFCSKKCTDIEKVGKPSWNKGIAIDRILFPTMGHFQKHTKEALEKITRANRVNAKKHGPGFFRKNQVLSMESARKNEFANFKGTLGKKKELSANWKGNSASYSSKHKWIQKYWIKTGVCQICGTRPKPFGIRRWGTEWHNMNGDYNRENKDDWIEVCSKCHKQENRNEARYKKT